MILDLPREHVSARYEILRHGAGGEATMLVCGGVTFNHPAAHNLIDLLPKIMSFDATSAEQTNRMKRTINLIAAEAEELLPGGEIVITRLADILVMQAIRAWLESAPATHSGLLAAVLDPQIGRAFSLIHRDPARAWTVASLASEVAMSRSAFSARFTELAGEPVMRYLTRRRMHIAVDSLAANGSTVGELANQLGYQSEAAFSRAFKRNVGQWPGAVRRSMKS
jgi:AraC-like DNA-binding protein